MLRFGHRLDIFRPRSMSIAHTEVPMCANRRPSTERRTLHLCVTHLICASHIARIKFMARYATSMSTHPPLVRLRDGPARFADFQMIRHS